MDNDKQAHKNFP